MWNAFQMFAWLNLQLVAPQVVPATPHPCACVVWPYLSPGAAYVGADPDPFIRWSLYREYAPGLGAQ